jgi:hypothetical protein
MLTLVQLIDFIKIARQTVPLEWLKDATIHVTTDEEISIEFLDAKEHKYKDLRIDVYSGKIKLVG